MKVAVLGESLADEAAIRILVGALLGRSLEPLDLPLRGRGWPAVYDILPTVIKHLNYHTDTQALVMVVDANSWEPHSQEHDSEAHPQCRLCQIRALSSTVQAQLRPVPQRLPLRTAFGLAVPAIEAWYLAGADPQVSESAWIQGLQSGHHPYTRNDLKRRVYGTDRPPLDIERRRAAEEATRLARDITVLEEPFPAGFGALARDVRSWITDQPN